MEQEQLYLAHLLVLLDCLEEFKNVCISYNHILYNLYRKDFFVRASPFCTLLPEHPNYEIICMYAYMHDMI